jgi:ferrous iron transport protein A
MKNFTFLALPRRHPQVLDTYNQSAFVRNKEADMEKRLTELLPGDQAVISRIELANGEMIRSIRVVRYAPLGDPLEVKFRGFHLSIRKTIARHILVTVENKVLDEVAAF